MIQSDPVESLSFIALLGRGPQFCLLRADLSIRKQQGQFFHILLHAAEHECAVRHACIGISDGARGRAPRFAILRKNL